MGSRERQRRILVIDGHPDRRPGRLIHALRDAYADAATSAGHSVRILNVAELAFPWLQTSDDFEAGSPPPAIQGAQTDITWCDHLVILYPLWLGSMPALLKAFFEQVMRPRFAFETRGAALPKKLLQGRSARIVVTMGMPAVFYRLFYRAHSLKSLRRNVLTFVGFHPIRTSVIGGAAAAKDIHRKAWLERMRSYAKSAK